MAFAATNFGATYTFIDAGGNTATRDYMMDATITTFTDAATEATTMLAKLVAVSDAVITNYRVYQVQVEQALSLPVNVQIENCASLTLLLSGVGNAKANANIPAPKNALFVSASTGPQNNIVNMSNSAVVAFTDSFLSSGKFTISDGQKISRSLSGKRVHKRSNKG
jgi:hypothetical protein